MILEHLFLYVYIYIYISKLKEIKKITEILIIILFGKYFLKCYLIA